MTRQPRERAPDDPAPAKVRCRSRRQARHQGWRVCCACGPTRGGSPAPAAAPGSPTQRRWDRSQRAEPDDRSAGNQTMIWTPS